MHLHVVACTETCVLNTVLFMGPSFIIIIINNINY